jgi:5-methylcytosine-specific restriction endonuclease McrBC regulatory subunit McrC
MREEAYQLMSYDAKFRTVDIRDTVLIPTPRKL